VEPDQGSLGLTSIKTAAPSRRRLKDPAAAVAVR
jgi:hypothetical protein